MYLADTDAFLLLIHFYPSLPQSLLLHTGKGKDAIEINIGSSYEGIGPNHAQALLVFHVFTGCDQTGSFSRKSKSLNASAKLGEELIATFTYNLHSETYML